MRRWIERLATLLVILLTVGVLLACWMPAYVTRGPTNRPLPRHGWE